MILQWFDILFDIYALLGPLGLLIVIGSWVLGFILYVLCLKWGIKKVKGSDNEFGSAFITALLSWICSTIPCGCFLSAYIISTRHKVTYGNGILALILAAILPLILVILLVIIFLVATGGLAAILSLLGL